MRGVMGRLGEKTGESGSPVYSASRSLLRGKAKLTVTIDDELLPRAKRYARARGATRIATRNVRDFRNSPIPTRTPRAVVEELSGS